MKIYFSASISGGRKFLPAYKEIVKYLQDNNHQVLTEHIIRDDVLDLEKSFKPVDIYERDIHWLNICDAVIAEVSNPSLGVGYEVCYAVEHQLPTLCIHQPDIFVSCMITGNNAPNLSLFEYKNTDELFSKIDSFLNEIEKKKE